MFSIFNSFFTGPSFANRKSDGKYHTIRYDFKPASLDPSKKGVLEMENSGESNSLNLDTGNARSEGRLRLKDPSVNF